MKIIISVLSFLYMGCGALQAQTLVQKTIEFPDDLQAASYSTYIARDYLTFSTGTNIKASQFTNGFHAKTNPNLIVPIGDDYRTGSEIINPATRALNTNLPFGATPSSFQVSTSGAATYSIPLQVAPGTAGMQPNLAITYNSQGSYGLLGLGWNLSGLSSICRTGSTFYHDNEAKGIQVNAEDNYLLDGERLYLYNGTHNTNNALYQKEDFDYSIIQLKDTDNDNSPDYFIVNTKTGNKLYYGNYNNSEASLQEGGLREYIWYLSRVEDTQGNYMIYEYEKNSFNSEIWLTRIKYTGNNSANIAPYNEVSFQYEIRKDSRTTQLNNYNLSVKNSLLLTKVSVLSEGELVRSYVPKYYFDNVTKLNEIFEYNAVGQHYNTIVVGWGEKSNSLISKYSLDEINHSSVNNNLIYGDFNGDGFIDIIKYTFYESDHLTKAFVYFFDANSKDYELVETFEDDGNKLTFYPGDIDGDGQSEVIVARDVLGSDDSHSTQLEVWFGQTSGLTKSNIVFEDYSTSVVAVGDFDGDKQDEILCYLNDNSSNKGLYLKDFQGDLNSSPTSTLITTTDLSDKYISAVDINRDGIEDVMLDEAFYDMEWNRIWEPDWGSSPVIALGDMNGNGYQNGIYWQPNSQNSTNMGWSMYPTPFTGFDLKNYLPALTNYYDKKQYVTFKDIDADGRQEILYFYNNSGLKLKIIDIEGAGQVNTNIYSLGINMSSIEGFFVKGFFDINGDGYEDCIIDNGYNYYAINFNKNSEEQLVTKIRDGSNTNYTISYKSMAGINDHEEIYQKQDNATFPIVDIRPSIRLVANATITADGIPISNTNYFYEGLKADARKGFLGFASVTSTETITNTSEEQNTQILQSQDRTKMVQVNSATSINNSKVGSNSASYLYSTLARGNTLLRVISSTQNNIINKSKVVTTYSSWDNGGNPQTIVNSIYDTKSGSDILALTQTNTTTFQKAQTTDYYNNVPTNNIIVNALPDAGTSTDKTQTVSYSYSNGLISQKTSNAGTNFEVRIYYEYDAVGNITKETIKNASNQVQGVTAFAYDTKKRFAQSKTNALDYTNSITFDPKTGNILSETNAIGQITSYAYNNFGTLVSKTTPFGTVTIEQNWYTGTEYTDAVYYVRSVSPHGKDTYEYFDAAGRNIAKKSKGFAGDYVYTETTYNERHQVAKISDPHFAGETVKYTSYSYNDTYYRPTALSGTGISYSYSYPEARKKVTTDNYGTKDTWESSNALGQVVQFNDFGGTTTYQYSAIGNPVLITNPSGQQTSMTYDATGQYQLSLNDPNAGITTYTYNNLGQILTHTDAKGNITTNEFNDDLGRLTQTTIGNETITYQYGTSGGALGQITSVNSSNGISYGYAYNSNGFLQNYSETIEGTIYPFSYTYDDYGRLHQTTYPGGASTTNNYSNGDFVSLSLNGQNVWTLNSMTSKGQVKQLAYNNGITTNYGFDAQYRPNAINTTGTNVVDLAYSWNSQTGNLTSRTAATGITTTENFTYDNDRLASVLKKIGSTDIGGYSINFKNDGSGRINSKSDLGIYNYADGAGFHALTSVTDADNVPIMRHNQDFTYTAFNKVSQVTQYKDGQPNVTERTYNITYGPDQQRRITEHHDESGLLKKKLYIAGMAEYEYNRTGSGMELTKRYFIPGPNGIAAVLETEADNTTKLYYLHTDYLGSIMAVTNANGNLVESNSYDAYGALRNPATLADYNDGTDRLMFDRGFTGHEHLAEFGLIDMNGRMYDPQAGLFLSPDPYVQSPFNSQNFNRYGYCLNNPFIYTDPTGEKWWHWALADVLTGGAVSSIGSSAALATASHFMTVASDPVSSAVHAWGAGVFDGLTSGNNIGEALAEGDRRAHNSWKISGGLLQSDSESAWEPAAQIFSRLTFQQPMTSMGLMYGQYLNMTGNVDVEYFHGATVIYDYDYGGDGAISIGGYIAMDRYEYGWVGGSWGQTATMRSHDYSNAILMHEYGHFLQTRSWGGQAFLPGAGASLLSAGLDWRSTGSHREIWVEQDANARAWAKFGDRMTGDALTQFSAGGDYENQRFYDDRFLRGYLLNDLFLTLMYDITWSR